MKKIKIISPILVGVTIVSALIPTLTACSNGKLQVKIVGNATCDVNEVDSKSSINLTIKANENKMLMNNITIKNGNNVLDQNSYFTAQSVDKTSMGVYITSDVITQTLTIEVPTINKIDIFNIGTNQTNEVVCNGFSNDFTNLSRDDQKNLIGDSMVIPAEVEVISSKAFYNAFNFQSTIPDSVVGITFGVDGTVSKLTRIEYEAFKFAHLIFAYLPDTLTNIGPRAFFDCENLSYIHFSKNLKNIGDGAFGHCISLLSIELPYSLTTIGTRSFADCYNLCYIELPIALGDDWQYFIGADCFTNASYFGELVVKTAYSAKLITKWNSIFSNWNITILPAIDRAYKTETETGTDNIGVKGFSDEFVALKDKPSEQQEWVGSKETLTLPGNIDSVSSNAFYNEDKNESLLPTWVQYVDFDNTYSEGVYGERIKSIGEKAFMASNINGVYIPASITKIDNAAFNNCENLTKIDLTQWIDIVTPESVPIAFKGISETGRIWYSSTKIKAADKDVNKFIEECQKYFKAASDNEIQFDDSHWKMVDINA